MRDRQSQGEKSEKTHTNTFGIVTITYLQLTHKKGCLLPGGHYIVSSICGFYVSKSYSYHKQKHYEISINNNMYTDEKKPCKIQVLKPIWVYFTKEVG